MKMGTKLSQYGCCNLIRYEPLHNVSQYTYFRVITRVRDMVWEEVWVYDQIKDNIVFNIALDNNYVI